MQESRFETVVRTMVHLHKAENGTYFLFSESGYYTLKKADSNFIFSNLVFWKNVEGILPMGECLAIKPTDQPDIFMYMQANRIIPISFVDDKVHQN